MVIIILLSYSSNYCGDSYTRRLVLIIHTHLTQIYGHLTLTLTLTSLSDIYGHRDVLY